VSSCTDTLNVAIEDTVVKVRKNNRYEPRYFLTDFKISGLPQKCFTATLDLEIILDNIDGQFNGIKNTYQLGDVIKCTKTISATTERLGDAVCTNTSRTTDFKLSDVAALDVDGSGPSLAIQISS
jgi:hypothetical protein